MDGIELARGSELARVVEVVRAAYALYIPRIGREPAPMRADYAAIIEQGRVHALHLDRVIVGVLVLERHEDHLLVENVAVDPGHQGRGIGSRLLAHAEEVARKAGLGELRLYTNARMTENLDYYPKHGYRRTGRAVEGGFDRVHFTKSLRAADQPPAGA